MKYLNPAEFSIASVKPMEAMRSRGGLPHEGPGPQPWSQGEDWLELDKEMSQSKIHWLFKLIKASLRFC